MCEYGFLSHTYRDVLLVCISFFLFYGESSFARTKVQEGVLAYVCLTNAISRGVNCREIGTIRIDCYTRECRSRSFRTRLEWEAAIRCHASFALLANYTFLLPLIPPSRRSSPRPFECIPSATRSSINLACCCTVFYIGTFQSCDVCRRDSSATGRTKISRFSERFDSTGSPRSLTEEFRRRVKRRSECGSFLSPPIPSPPLPPHGMLITSFLITRAPSRFAAH